jgi:hypothetical protein
MTFLSIFRVFKRNSWPRLTLGLNVSQIYGLENACGAVVVMHVKKKMGSE